MIAWILQITIISFIFIFLIHHLIQFFKDTLTVPKTKDLVNHPGKKYEHIYNILSKENKKSINENRESTSEISFLPVLQQEKQEEKSENREMKDELKNFLKNQLNTSDSQSSYYQFK